MGQKTHPIGYRLGYSDPGVRDGMPEKILPSFSTKILRFERSSRRSCTTPGCRVLRSSDQAIRPASSSIQPVRASLLAVRARRSIN